MHGEASNAIKAQKIREDDVPYGYIAVDYGLPKQGELFLETAGPHKGEASTAPFNFGSIKCVILAEVPEGYVCAGWRKPKMGEKYLNYYDINNSNVVTAGHDFTVFDMPILESVEGAALVRVEVEYRIEVLGQELPVEDLLVIRDALNTLPLDLLAQANAEMAA